MTYAAGFYRHFSTLQQEIYEVQQSLLWEALDNLDKDTDPYMELNSMEDIFVDKIQGSKSY